MAVSYGVDYIILEKSHLCEMDQNGWEGLMWVRMGGVVDGVGLGGNVWMRCGACYNVRAADARLLHVVFQCLINLVSVCVSKSSGLHGPRVCAHVNVVIGCAHGV